MIHQLLRYNDMVYLLTSSGNITYPITHVCMDGHLILEILDNC